MGLLGGSGVVLSGTFGLVANLTSRLTLEELPFKEDQETISEPQLDLQNVIAPLKLCA